MYQPNSICNKRADVRSHMIKMKISDTEIAQSAWKITNNQQRIVNTEGNEWLKSAFVRTAYWMNLKYFFTHLGFSKLFFQSSLHLKLKNQNLVWNSCNSIINLQRIKSAPRLLHMLLNENSKMNGYWKTLKPEFFWYLSAVQCYRTFHTVFILKNEVHTNSLLSSYNMNNFHMNGINGLNKEALFMRIGTAQLLLSYYRIRSVEKTHINSVALFPI